jgi:serine/threonine protein kinase
VSDGSLRGGPEAAAGGLGQLGRYTIDRLIARGGMAEVFLARMQGPGGFSKVVVIKRILPTLVADETFVRMFLDEARLAAMLTHPNIVQVFDFGEEDGSYYIAMEYIRGVTLRTIQKHFASEGRALDPTLAARICIDVCKALAYAHELKDESGKPLHIVHRDVSPDNVIVATTGTAKLVDFGIAKARSNDAMTQSGTVKGKYAYIAPEQLLERPVTGQLDIYAVGIALYEILTGVRPFRGRNVMEIFRAILEAKVLTASEVNARIPRRSR